MRIPALKLVSWLGLTLTLLPSFFVFSGALSLDAFKVVVLVGSVLWLGTAPLWVNRDRSEES
jgi:NADH:ubiquinone oxidoreductase subunit 6 (subunit J)